LEVWKKQGKVRENDRDEKMATLIIEGKKKVMNAYALTDMQYIP